MSDITLQLVLGILAFVALMFVALGAGSNIYAAVFPQDTSTQDLVQRLEFLACENNFQSQRSCQPNQRSAQMVFSFAARGNDDLLIVFEKGEQEILWDHQVVNSAFTFGIFNPTVTRQRYRYINPTTTAAVCRTVVNEQVGISDCVPLLINETTRVSRQLGLRGGTDYSSHNHQEYTELYNDMLAYGEAIIHPRKDYGEDIVLPEWAFLLYLEYTPPSDDQPSRLLVTPYDQRTHTVPTRQAARVGVRYDGSPQAANPKPVNPSGRGITYRSWCYEDEWKYQLPYRNLDWTSASAEFYTVNAGGADGHQQLTQRLASSNFQEGVQVLVNHQSIDGYYVDIPSNPQSVRGACT